MLTFDELQETDNVAHYVSRKLRHALRKSSFKLQVLEADSNEITDADLLIEDTFPRKEAEEFKPSVLFNLHDQLLVLACMRKGVVVGVVTLSIEDEEAQIHSLAVDKEYRNQKLGSILMIAVNDLSMELGISNLSLISSAYGQSFYESWGFEAKAHQSYDCTLPLDSSLCARKLEAFAKEDGHAHNRSSSEEHTLFPVTKKSRNEPEEVVQVKPEGRP